MIVSIRQNVSALRVLHRFLRVLFPPSLLSAGRVELVGSPASPVPLLILSIPNVLRHNGNLGAIQPCSWT